MPATPNENIAAYKNAAYPTLTTVAAVLDQIITDGLALADITAPVTLETYTQTGYSTAARTVPAVPADTLVLTATDIAAKTASLTLTDSDVASLAAMKVTNDQLAKDIGTAHNLLVADVLALKKLVTALIDDLQAWGIVA